MEKSTSMRGWRVVGATWRWCFSSISRLVHLGQSRFGKEVNMSAEKERVVKTICGMCQTHCGIDVHVRGNTIVKIEPMKEHILRRLCVKATAITDLQYSKERLLYPLKKVNGSFKRISWDEALDMIISKLTYTKERYGPQALAIEYGHAVFIKESIGLMKTFAEAYGTPNLFDCGNVCGWPTVCGQKVTCGGDYLAYHLGRTHCYVNWGLNAWHSQTAGRFLIERLKEKGAKIIVIDPRTTSEAKMADLHIRVRPGTDLALALALMNVIITEELYDKEFVDKWTIGFDELAEAVRDYTPHWAAGVTGAPAKDIEELARLYATIKPACIANVVCLDQSSNAFQAHRALTILMAITGNLDAEGGNKILKWPPHRLMNWIPPDDEYVPCGKSFTADRFPIWEEIIKEPQGSAFADTLLTGKPYPIKSFIAAASGMLRSYPNQNKLREAITKLDFMVVMDVFMTELAERADIVLPATTWLESRWCDCYEVAHLPMIAVANKVFEPSGECWSDDRFWIELGRRMGYEDHFPWTNSDEAIDDILHSIGHSLEEVDEYPGGFFYHPREFKAYEREGFKTPSGRVEIYAERLEKMGLPPLPVPYIEPLISPISTPELFSAYPLMALSGTRTQEYEHTTGRNLPALRSKRPDPEIQMNPEDAKESDIEHGEWVTIESPQGKCTMKADISADTPKGIVSMPHGWGGESNVNFLTSDDHLDPIVGAAILKGFACRVRKAV